MPRKILISALILQSLAGFGDAFSNTPTQFETSQLTSTQQQAFVIFEEGKAAHDGIDTPQDFVRARMLYLEAAELGNIDALINLGFLYFAGQGVEADFVKAREFYEIAAKRGSDDAVKNLRMMDARGLGILAAAAPNAATIRNVAPQAERSAVSLVPVKTPTSNGRTAPSVDAMKIPQTQAVLMMPDLDADALDSLDFPINVIETGENIGDPIAALPAAPAQLVGNPKALGQNPSSNTNKLDKITALLMSLAALTLLIYFILARKQMRDRKIREKFAHFFYEAKRSDLRLTYLRRRNDDFVYATFYKEWHATLTVLMARYALNFDEPDEALRAFCKKLNHGLSLRSRPTQHLAFEFSDRIMRAARSEIKAVDAFHMARITDGTRPALSTNIVAPDKRKFRDNVVKLFHRNNV